jgi:hypothetical protein
MEEKHFDSSYLSRGIYNSESKELIISFKTNEQPKMFYDVPQEVWNEMKESASAGSFYHAKIKKEYEYSVWGENTEI